jgi:hypothetical protein
MLIGLIFNIIFTTIGIVHLHNQIKAHRAALIALAHALRLLAERQVEKRVSREGEWN